MSLHKQLLSLQWSQYQHDYAYHREIVSLPLYRRISHMALHYAKYTSYFLSSILHKDLDFLSLTLADTFAISLATANTLNQNIGQEMESIADNLSSITELGCFLVQELPRDNDDIYWIAHQTATFTAQIAKACESLDHIESLPFRENMKSANISIFKTVLAEASARDMNLEELYHSRMREVEKKSIFDHQLQLQLQLQLGLFSNGDL